MKNFKRVFSLMLTALMLVSAMIVPANAADQVLGNVLHTNIVTYIDGYPIQSYNIGGYTYVIAEDLLNYGFDVQWFGAENKLWINPVHSVDPSKYTTTFKPTANTNEPGSVASQYVYTAITTWIGDTKITGYNIGGMTCICVDDLAIHFAENLATDYVFDGTKDTLSLKVKKNIPGSKPSVVLPTTAPSNLTIPTAEVKDFVKQLAQNIVFSAMDANYRIKFQERNIWLSISNVDGMPLLTAVESSLGKHTFETPIELYGDFEWNVFQIFMPYSNNGVMEMDHLLVFTKYVDGIGLNYMWLNGKLEKSWTDVKGQSGESLSLFQSNSVGVEYVRRAGKYAGATSFADVAKVITSGNEFFEERGAIWASSGKLTYSPNKDAFNNNITYKVSDVYNIEAEYAALRKADPTLPATLAALYARNSGN